MSNNVNDIRAVNTAFKSALGNGKGAAKHLATLVHAVANAGDGNTGPLARALNDAVGKSDAAAVKAIRATIGSVWPGAKSAKDKNGNIVIKISGCIQDADALARLDAAVKKGLSLRDTFVKHVKGEAAKPKVSDAKLMTTKATNFVKAMRTHKMTEAAAIAAIKAAYKAQAQA